MSQAKVIRVIKTDELKGVGSREDPYRRITQYWTLDGIFIMEDDTYHLTERMNQLSHELTKERRKNETKP